ncbi:hypothetical protein BC833DRAFT_578028, partial [Globomyces pollinis-pini]
MSGTTSGIILGLTFYQFIHAWMLARKQYNAYGDTFSYQLQLIALITLGLYTIFITINLDYFNSVYSFDLIRFSLAVQSLLGLLFSLLINSAALIQLQSFSGNSSKFLFLVLVLTPIISAIKINQTFSLGKFMFNSTWDINEIYQSMGTGVITIFESIFSTILFYSIYHHLNRPQYVQSKSNQSISQRIKVLIILNLINFIAGLDTIIWNRDGLLLYTLPLLQGYLELSVLQYLIGIKLDLKPSVEIFNTQTSKKTKRLSTLQLISLNISRTFSLAKSNSKSKQTYDSTLSRDANNHSYTDSTSELIEDVMDKIDVLFVKPEKNIESTELDLKSKTTQPTQMNLSRSSLQSKNYWTNLRSIMKNEWSSSEPSEESSNPSLLRHQCFWSQLKSLRVNVSTDNLELEHYLTSRSSVLYQDLDWNFTPMDHNTIYNDDTLIDFEDCLPKPSYSVFHGLKNLVRSDTEYSRWKSIFKPL